MNLRNRSDRYGTPSIALHWLMLLLLVAVYTTVNLAEAFPKGSVERDGLRAWHFALGLSVLALVVVRLAVNFSDRAPGIAPEPPAWQARSATLMHLALYALMIGLPLLGWLLLSARGRPIPFFGFELPPLIGENRSAARFIKELHEIGGTCGYFLIGLHAVAALFHHYVARDNTLRRMLPG